MILNTLLALRSHLFGWGIALCCSLGVSEEFAMTWMYGIVVVLDHSAKRSRHIFDTWDSTVGGDVSVRIAVVVGLSFISSLIRPLLLSLDVGIEVVSK